VLLRNDSRAGPNDGFGGERQLMVLISHRTCGAGDEIRRAAGAALLPILACLLSTCRRPPGLTLTGEGVPDGIGAGQRVGGGRFGALGVPASLTMWARMCGR
jgi:hypothetical protein